MKELVWYRVPDLTKLHAEREEQIYVRKIQNKSLCFTFYHNSCYAFDMKCPHQYGPMAQGFIDSKGHIVCPWHRFAFSLESGASEKGGYVLPTYKVKLDNGSYWVAIPRTSPWWKWWT